MPPRLRGPANRSGFALLVVIWGLGVIMLLIVSFMTTARWRLQAAFNAAGAAQAQLLADGVVNLAILALLSEQSAGNLQGDRPIHDGAARYCSFSGVAVAIAIEDESGKVDLNAAPAALLQAMLIGFGVDLREADAQARAIVAFRDEPTNDIGAKPPQEPASDRPFGPKRAPFQTTLELDQVVGIDPPLLRSLLPVVTVHSHGAGIDAQSAPPALFAALAGYPADEVRALAATPYPNNLDRRDPRFPKAFLQGGVQGGLFLVHVEVAQPSGQTGVEEAIVQTRGDAVDPFTILELRHGEMRSKTQLRGMAPSALPAC